MGKTKQSLESFVQNTNTHCYTCIKKQDEVLDQYVRSKIKVTLSNLLGRHLTEDEKKIVLIFTGVKKKTLIHGVFIQVGTVRWGMLKVLTKHFRDNGDKNGGRVDYIDIIKIPKILNTCSPTLQDNGRHKYTYVTSKKSYILITNEFRGKWNLHTFYSEDIS